MVCAHCAEVRAGAKKQQESDLEEIRFLQAEQDNLREMADLILQKVFLGGPEAGVSSAWPEHLKMVPDRLMAKVKDTAIAGIIQALAMVKSHYPFVDQKRFEAGYTAGTDEDKLDALTSKMETTAEVLVELLELDEV